MKQDPHILVALPLLEHQKQALQKTAPQATFCFRQVAQVTAQDVEKADILMGKIDPALCCHAQKAVWFQSHASGPDAYLKPGVLPPHVAITTCTGAYGLAVSEHMLAMTLAVMKRLHTYRDSQHRGEWVSQGAVTSMEDAKVLVIGLGDLGENYARRCAALGAQVTGVRRSQAQKPACLQAVYSPQQLNELLPQADIVALCLPGSASTYHILDAARLNLMKPGAILVNGGRGNAVDTEALLQVLRSGHLLGAALDVTDPEPLPQDHPLWNEPSAFITPHISGMFHLPQSLERIVNISCENLGRWLADMPLRNQVQR